MNIYICNLPIHFPSSEYGGTVVVIAKSPKQCGKILTEYYKDSEYFDLSLAINRIKRFALDPTKEYTAGVVDEFRT